MAFFGSRLSRSDVLAAYEVLLGRAPENEAAVAGHREHGSFRTLIQALVDSPEYKTRHTNSPFMGYASSFDPVEVIKAHEFSGRSAVEGHRVNFLGVAMNLAFVPDVPITAEVEGLPIPANWHACVAEWGAALRAVDLAKDRFTMAELGCGWGCWMNNTAVAAKRRGLEVQVFGIEGDHGHVAFAEEALARNGIKRSEYRLNWGIAAGKSGVALFPKQTSAGASWGLEPIFSHSPGFADAKASGRYDELPMLSLKELIADVQKLDLLHIDIQGGELALITETIDLLNSKVAYLVIGTHSRMIDGALMNLLLEKGWTLEIERPTIHVVEQGRPSTRVDGIQGWRNPLPLPS